MSRYYNPEYVSNSEAEEKLQVLETLEDRLEALHGRLRPPNPKIKTILDLLRQVSFVAMHIKDGTHLTEFGEFKSKVEKLEKE